MSRFVRGLLAGVFALVAVFAITSSASALIINPTSISGRAGATTLTINGTSRTITATCANSTVAGTATNSGAGVRTAAVSITSAAFLSCQLAGSNLTVTTSNLPWAGTLTALTLSGSNAATGTLGITGILAEFRTAAGCNFVVTGTRTSDVMTGAAGVFTNISFTNAALTLRVALVLSTGIACSSAGIAVGLSATLQGTFTLSPPITVTS